jgi:hypothetical protein
LLHRETQVPLVKRDAVVDMPASVVHGVHHSETNQQLHHALECERFIGVETRTGAIAERANAHAAGVIPGDAFEILP